MLYTSAKWLSYDWPIVKAVCFVSFSVGSGIDKNIPLFIFDASKDQFEMPTKAILLSPSFKSYSNWECMTFKGLLGECSANPISSKKIKDILFFLSSSFSLLYLSLDNLKTFRTPSEVLSIEPWYEFNIIFGNLLNNKAFEELPFIALFINWTLKDLLQPGLPTIKIGILLLIVTNNENILSNKALFFAIPFSSSMLFTTYNSSFWGTSRKSFPLKLSSKLLNISFNLILNSFLELMSVKRK